MVKPLTFKGDKPKKRKRTTKEPESDDRRQLQKTDADAEDNAAKDDSWVSAEAMADVTGPVVIVLPTDTPSALSCDQNGTVFPIPLENVVDANPASAEPHDVRQVWVANRVVGTENFQFKGHHGRFLSCDSIGQLSATSEAVSPLELFNVVPTADTPGTFQLQTQRGTYITIKEPKASTSGGKKPAPQTQVRGDAEEIAFATTLRIRMQARFKPRIKATKEERAYSKISRSQLEEAAGRRLTDDEAKMLKRARKEGDYHEKLLGIKVKNKHDKFG